MHTKLLWLTAALALSAPVILAPTVVEAQRSSPARPSPALQGSWDLLGETRVGFGVDRDVISIGRTEADYRNRSYDKLRINAERGDVRMREVKLRYINGVTEDIPVEKLLRAGESVIVELKERRSFLSQIELTYGAREGSGGGFLGRWNQPRVKVYGLNRGSGLPPRELANWDEIGQTLTGRGDDNVTITVGRREGRFGQIRLRNEGQPLTLRSASVRFGNGETQSILLRGTERLGTGETSPAIDVDGQQRFIERIVLRFDRLNGPMRGTVTVFGSQRPGGATPPPPPSNPQASWVPLGEQTVSFRGDRDTIKLANDEGWYRTRSFDKLHFQSAAADIELDDIRIVYINGYAETIRVGRELRRGTSLTVDLPGNRSYLREIEMRYRTKPGSDQRGIMKVFGEPVRR